MNIIIGLFVGTAFFGFIFSNVLLGAIVTVIGVVLAAAYDGVQSEKRNGK